MRFGLPAPSLIVPVTSRVVVSMIDTGSPLVFVMYRLDAAAGTATATIATSTSMRTADVTRASSGRLLDRADDDERRRSTHAESYRVAGGKRIGNLRRDHPEPHRHARHVPGNVLVREHDDPEVRQDGADDAVDARPLAFGAAPRPRLPGRGIRGLRGPPRRESAGAEEEQQRVDDDDGLPRPHFTARLAARRASARTAALISPLASPRGAPRPARRHASV